MPKLVSINEALRINCVCVLKLHIHVFHAGKGERCLHFMVINICMRYRMHDYDPIVLHYNVLSKSAYLYLKSNIFEYETKSFHSLYLIYNLV